MQALYKYALQGSPVKETSSVAPAVVALDAAVRELFDSRVDSQKALFRKIVQKKKELLEKETKKAGVMESAYALIHELERMRVANVYGIDTGASHTAFVIYTLHQNYLHVFDTLKDTFNKDRASNLSKRLRKLSL
jgi:activator of 2-hydroxyglutaryl-CoA dehydratase